MKRLWVVRAGRFGEREDKALAQAKLMPGFEDVPPLTGRADRDSMIEVLRDAFPMTARTGGATSPPSSTSS
jgi:restriction system protein